LCWGCQHGPFTVSEDTSGTGAYRQIAKSHRLPTADQQDARYSYLHPLTLRRRDANSPRRVWRDQR
jgi:hypothetical protein